MSDRRPPCRGAWAAAAVLSVAAAASGAQQPARPAHAISYVTLSPDGRFVASVEGENAPRGGDPVVRELVIRRADGGSRGGGISVVLPCARLRGCWPSYPAWTPDSRRLTFVLRDPDTHARSLYQVNPDGTHLTQLLAFNGTIQALRYSPDGQLSMLAIEHASKEPGAVEAGAPAIGDLDRAPPEQRIALLEQNHLRWVSPADLFVYEYDWTPDGHGFVGTAAAGDGDGNWWVARLYAFDSDAASPRLLYAPANPQQQLAEPRVSRDGKRVAFIVGLMSDFGLTGGDIYTVPLSGGPATAVTPGLPATVTALRWNCRAHIEAVTLAGAQSQFVDFGSGTGPSAGTVLWQSQELLGGSPNDVYGVSAAACPSNTQALLHQSFNLPPEIEIGAIGKWRDLTRLNEGLATQFTVRSVSWTSDAWQVQGWLVLPESGAARPPLITIVHGGPAAAFTARFIGASQYETLARHGYALFMPNPRGSFGAGEAFVAGNVRDFGHGDLRDILAGLDAVAALGLTDPDRLGIMGGSYGGFMTMWAVTQTDRFKVAVAGAGISNWRSYYGENGIDEWMIPFFGASVYDDPEVYERSSPINFIRQVHTPVFSFVGAADIECPAPQTQEFGRALKVLGRPSMTVIYPDEGHHLHDPDRLADLDARMLAWIDRYLK
jgi:dipeptidyl aminopeptidase/acylaminoacyl peptidase